MRLPDLNDLMQDLQLAKQMAIDDHNPNALVVATIAQAKLLGRVLNSIDSHLNGLKMAKSGQTVSNS